MARRTTGRFFPVSCCSAWAQRKLFAGREQSRVLCVQIVKDVKEKRNENQVAEFGSLGMKTLEELAAWKTKKWMPWTSCGWYPSKPATEESVAYIETALKVRLPRDFVEFSRLVHNYGVWFGSIGDDYDSHNHLLRLNEAFHKPEDGDIALPERWVLINHGHDGDCDCLDVSGGTSSEYPIYYINVESPSEPVLMANAFREYLERHA